MDNKEKIADLLNSFSVLRFRYTFDSEEHSDPEKIFKLFITSLEKSSCILYNDNITAGYETQISDFPNSGLPTTPHIHIHLLFKNSAYDLTNETQLKNWKKKRSRVFSQLVDPKNTMKWGNKKTATLVNHIDDDDIKDITQILQYPLKQYKYTSKRLDHLCSVTNYDFELLKQTAIGLYDIALESSQKNRKKQEAGSENRWFIDLSSKAIENDCKTRKEVFKTFLQHYILHQRPPCRIKINQYVELYWLSNHESYIDDYVDKNFIQ